jgi:endonuclease/exonuclease/phosphatase family metal-dependent hydrolase
MGFSVATWNVLAQSYFRADRYKHCDPRALDLKGRHTLLLERIARLNVDVLLLQEVERQVHDAIAAQLGPTYRSAFTQRKGRPDGASVFSRLRWLGDEVLHYAAGEAQLAQLATLEVEGRTLVVASTHLQWTAPGHHPIGREQLLELVPRRPHLIGGDFNADPQSAVLRAAFDAGYVEGGRGDTCNIGRAPRKIDFLLSLAPLVPMARSVTKLDADAALPSLTEPSDHLPVIVDYDLGSTGR